MKKKFLILFALIFGAFTYAVGQYVSNVRYHITDSAVTIFYDLCVNADVSIYVSTDNGKTFSKELYFVEGDVGTNVSPGKYKKIIWPISSKDLPDKLSFKVDAKPIKSKSHHPIKTKNAKKGFRPDNSIVFGFNFDFNPQKKFKFDGFGGGIGYMKRIGFYVNFLSNYKQNRSDIPITENNTTDYLHSEDHMRRSIDIGLLVRTCKPLTIKLGCGFGKYKEFEYCTIPSSYSFYQNHGWLYNPNNSIQGIEFNLGLLFHIKWFNLSLETTTIKFKHYDVRFGVGFSFDW